MWELVSGDGLYFSTLTDHYMVIVHKYITPCFFARAAVSSWYLQCQLLYKEAKRLQVNLLDLRKCDSRIARRLRYSERLLCTNVAYSLQMKLNRCRNASYRRLIRQRRKTFRAIALEVHGPCTPRLCWLPLHLMLNTLLFGLFLLRSILLDPAKEVLTGTRGANMLYPDVDSLLHVAVANPFVEDDADGGFGDVVDDAGFAVVDLVWHTVGWEYLISDRVLLWVLVWFYHVLHGG